MESDLIKKTLIMGITSLAFVSGCCKSYQNNSYLKDQPNKTRIYNNSGDESFSNPNWLKDILSFPSWKRQQL